MKTIPLHKSLLLVFSVLLTVGLAVSPEMGSATVLAGPRKKATQCPYVATQEAFIFAQNEEGDPAHKERKGGFSEPDESDAKPETKRQKKDLPPGSNSKPLKGFVPSEEIEADQAVDFPYDI